MTDASSPAYCALCDRDEPPTMFETLGEPYEEDTSIQTVTRFPPFVRRIGFYWVYISSMHFLLFVIHDSGERNWGPLWCTHWHVGRLWDRAGYFIPSWVLAAKSAAFMAGWLLRQRAVERETSVTNAFYFFKIFMHVTTASLVVVHHEGVSIWWNCRLYRGRLWTCGF